MKPDTMPLFQREMHGQVTAARAALTEAQRRGDPLLVQAAENHLDALLGLARRNGLAFDSDGSPMPVQPDGPEALLADGNGQQTSAV